MYSYKICEKLKRIYILTVLNKFTYNDMKIFVYGEHTSLVEWMQTKTNVAKIFNLPMSFYKFCDELNILSYFLIFYFLNPSS